MSKHRGKKRPGQIGTKAIRRRLKRSERARQSRSKMRFDRFVATRQGQKWLATDSPGSAWFKAPRFAKGKYVT